MDLSKLTLGTKVVLGAGALLLIDSFLHWQEISFGPISAGVSMWHGWGLFVGLLLLAILALEAAQMAGMKIALGPLSPSMGTAGLSALLVLFALLKVLTNSYVAIWAWIGLVLSVAVAIGAWMNMKAAGESLSDLKTSVTAAASSATAAARTSSPSAPPAAAPDAGTGETSSNSDEAST
jgi:hypothetical protein